MTTPHAAKGRKFWSGPPRERKPLFAIARLVVIVAVTAVAIAGCGGSSSSSVPPKQRFVKDVAAAGLISADPNVKAAINIPAGADSDDEIFALGDEICTDLKKGTSKPDEAHKQYEDALGASLIPGGQAYNFSYDKAVKLVDLAVQDVCPGT
jgi:hypothetical protein